jgi:hypothetical protein
VKLTTRWVPPERWPATALAIEGFSATQRTFVTISAGTFDLFRPLCWWMVESSSRSKKSQRVRKAEDAPLPDRDKMMDRPEWFKDPFVMLGDDE